MSIYQSLYTIFLISFVYSQRSISGQRAGMTISSELFKLILKNELLRSNARVFASILNDKLIDLLEQLEFKNKCVEKRQPCLALKNMVKHHWRGSSS